MGNQIISVEEVEVQPRGRKTELDDELAADLASLTEGDAMVLSDTFGNVAKSKQSTVAQKIRKHWKAVRADKCRIDWSNDGLAQVRVRATTDEDSEDESEEV